ncbi:MAG: hypothetical protein ACE5H1_07660, partial [Thermodesulfobacteriota bacterium]
MSHCKPRYDRAKPFLSLPKGWSYCSWYFFSDVGAVSRCEYYGDLKVAATLISSVAENFSPPYR